MYFPGVGVGSIKTDSRGWGTVDVRVRVVHGEGPSGDIERVGSYRREGNSLA